MSKIRVCFFGTPDFAVVCLKSLLSDEHYEVVGVVTQPDRPSGRKLQLTPSLVKQLAIANNLKVVSPASLKSEPEIVEEIKSWGAEVGVVVAFGQILTEEFMQSFPFGCVNVHGSLLPRWRGAAPIQRSIEAGDVETGVALQKMVKKLDAGDVIGIRKIPISKNMDAQELHDKLADLGASLLSVEMMDWLRGNLVAVPQDETQVTYAKKIEKDEAMLDWNQSAKNLNQKIRAFVYGPGTYTLLQGKKLKIHKTDVVDNLTVSSKKIGSILKISTDSFSVVTGQGVLEVFEVQPESRNKIQVVDFLKGHSLQVGDVLGV